MSGRKKPSPLDWVETDREQIPDSLQLFFGDERNTHSYATMRYRVWEKRGDDVRVREISGEPLYARDHPDLTDLFEIARIALRTIQATYQTESKK